VLMTALTASTLFDRPHAYGSQPSVLFPRASSRLPPPTCFTGGASDLLASVWMRATGGMLSMLTMARRRPRQLPARAHFLLNIAAQ